MKNYLLHVVCLFLFFIGSNFATAQEQEIEVFGNLVEEETAQPVPYATVALYKTGTEELITGVISAEDGTFSVSTTQTNFYVKISFMGYQSKTLTAFTISGDEVNLGTVSLAPDMKLLDQIVVEGEVSKTTFQLDKRVFNVGKDLSTTGASALEVLNNVPSVNVNIDGEISLRGSAGVQILINGKPSILTDGGTGLGTITADMIESIEVITNPSAKYEASGTSGILNIVLKKESKEGWNGSISANTGIPANHSLGGSINRRTEKFNLFTQFGIGHRSRPRQTEAINRNLISGQTILSDGEEFRNETFFNIRLGTDYHLNEYNVFTLSGNFAYEIEDQPSETNFSFLEDDNTISQVGA